MPAYQYIYVMKGLNKTYPGGRQVLKDIWLSFLPGAKIGVLGVSARRNRPQGATQGTSDDAEFRNMAYSITHASA
jgi:hypothetical protein